MKKTLASLLIASALFTGCREDRHNSKEYSLEIPIITYAGQNQIHFAYETPSQLNVEISNSNQDGSSFSRPCLISPSARSGPTTAYHLPGKIGSEFIILMNNNALEETHLFHFTNKEGVFTPQEN